MAIKKYTVTLEEETVNKALKISEKYGGRLSRILNRLLEEWNIKETKKYGGINGKEIKSLDGSSKRI